MDKPTKKEVAKEVANVIIDHCESIQLVNPKGAPHLVEHSGYTVGEHHPNSGSIYPTEEEFNK